MAPTTVNEKHSVSKADAVFFFYFLMIRLILFSPIMTERIHYFVSADGHRRPLIIVTARDKT